jgi:hypothetical protein
MAAPFTFSLPPELSAKEPPERRGIRRDQVRLLVIDRASGAVEGPALDMSLIGNRYEDFVGFPDGSVAFAAPGSSATQIKVLRVLPCNG